MNPNSSKEAPGLNLPPPVGEQSPAIQSTEATPQPEVAAQAMPASPERAPSSAAAGAGAAQPVMPLPVPGDDSSLLQQIQQDDVTTTASQPSKTGLIKDEDLIEKEWVEKAKRIVEHTRDDPHQQSEQLTTVKADYMKRRYDKTIKVDK